MTVQPSDSQTVTEVFPEMKQLPLQGLYLGQGLAGMAAQAHRSLVLTTYLTDRNGVIAKADEQHHFKVPAETRNDSDWRLSQELMAQADVIITGGDYLQRVSTTGSHPQDVLYQFEAGGKYADLGEWRLRAGYEKRSPDVAVVARDLDFTIPEPLRQSGRRIAIFTTYGLAESEQAKALTHAGAVVLGSGESGVEGGPMIDYLSGKMGARVIVSTTGPGVLQLLLAANRLDLFYITRVQRDIPSDDPSSVKQLLPDGERVEDLKEFRLCHQYVQDSVTTADGSHVSQHFLRYDKMAD